MTERRHLADALRAWSLTADGAEILTPRARLVPVRRGAEPAMLKILSAVSDETDAARALRHFAGRGAVRVLEDGGRIVLLERAVPGTPLTDLVAAGRDEEATEVLAETIRALHLGDPPAGFQTAEDWADGFERQRARGPHPRLRPALLDRAETFWRELAASQGPRFLLHGDLHHDNLLRDRRGWLVIDPKGIVAESALETAMALRNPIRLWPFPAGEAVMRRRVAILCECLALDRARVLGWAFALMVLSACWQIEDDDADTDVVKSLALAEVVDALLRSR